MIPRVVGSATSPAAGHPSNRNSRGKGPDRATATCMDWGLGNQIFHSNAAKFMTISFVQITGLRVVIVEDTTLSPMLLLMCCKVDTR